MKKINKFICGFSVLLFLFTVMLTNVFAYHTRGSYSGSPGFFNQPADSDTLYKVETHRDWVVSGTANPAKSLTEYKLVNSNGATRGKSFTSSSTFGIVELTSTGERGYMYKMRLTKQSSNLFSMYHIEADWDTDSNR